MQKGTVRNHGAFSAQGTQGKEIKSKPVQNAQGLFVQEHANFKNQPRNQTKNTRIRVCHKMIALTKRMGQNAKNGLTTGLSGCILH